MTLNQRNRNRERQNWIGKFIKSCAETFTCICLFCWLNMCISLPLEVKLPQGRQGYHLLDLFFLFFFYDLDLTFGTSHQACLNYLAYDILCWTTVQCHQLRLMKSIFDGSYFFLYNPVKVNCCFVINMHVLVSSNVQERQLFHKRKRPMV